jgi:hypothetical protein
VVAVFHAEKDAIWFWMTSIESRPKSYMASRTPPWCAAQNFGTNVVTYLMVVVIVLVILMPMAGELGKRMQ